MPQPSSTYVGITTFYVVDETDSGVGTLYTWSGYKVQPWPAASYEDAYRFEKDDLATGYVYDYGATDSAKWSNQWSRTLAGAMSGLASSASIIFAFLAYSTF